MSKLKKLKKICLIVAVNVLILVVLLLLAELGYRFYRDGFLGAFARMQAGVPYSNLGTHNWMIFDDELGFRLNPARYKINKRSLRHGPIAIPKPPGVLRVVALGDSLSWDRPSFVDFLREKMGAAGKVEVINAGTPGYTAYQEVLFYRRYLKDIEPDLVIWTYCLNDNYRFLHSFDQHGNMLMTDEAMESLRTHSFWDVLISRSYLLTLARVSYLARRKETQSPPDEYIWRRQPDFNAAWKDYSWGLYEAQLKQLLAMVQGKAKLVIMMVPYEPQLLARADANQAFVRKPQRMLAALCKKYGVPCLDLFEAFSAEHERKEKLYIDGIHLNYAGHQLVFSQLMRFLPRTEPR